MTDGTMRSGNTNSPNHRGGNGGIRHRLLSRSSMMFPMKEFKGIVLMTLMICAAHAASDTNLKVTCYDYSSSLSSSPPIEKDYGSLCPKTGEKVHGSPHTIDVNGLSVNGTTCKFIEQYYSYGHEEPLMPACYGNWEEWLKIIRYNTKWYLVEKGEKTGHFIHYDSTDKNWVLKNKDGKTQFVATNMCQKFKCPSNGWETPHQREERLRKSQEQEQKQKKERRERFRELKKAEDQAKRNRKEQDELEPIRIKHSTATAHLKIIRQKDEGDILKINGIVLNNMTFNEHGAGSQPPCYKKLGAEKDRPELISEERWRLAKNFQGRCGDRPWYEAKDGHFLHKDMLYRGWCLRNRDGDLVLYNDSNSGNPGSLKANEWVDVRE